jgi:hypothetical protein
MMQQQAQRTTCISVQLGKLHAAHRAELADHMAHPLPC